MTAPHFVRPDHHPLPTGTRHDALGHDGTSTARRPRQSTAPAGLWAPAPEVIREKAVKPKKQPSGNAARLAPCGSETAAKRHKRNGEVDADGQITCRVCIDGRKARRTTNRKLKPVKPIAPGSRCGSRLGYDDHIKFGEKTCAECKKAMAAYVRRRASLRKAEPKKPPTTTAQCGSTAGRPAHRRRNEWPCEACKEAVNAAARQAFKGRAA